MSLFGLEAENVMLVFLWLCDCLGFYRGLESLFVFQRRFAEKIFSFGFQILFKKLIITI